MLSWDDTSNNQSLQQGKAGWIHNPVSAYIVARNSKLPSADGINHHKSLAGPDGQRHETDVPRHIGIWKFSKNIEPGKEWIRYLLGKREVYDEYIMSGDAFNLPAYTSLVDHPVLRPIRSSPRSRTPRASSSIATAGPRPRATRSTHHQFLHLPNMIAKAVTGTSTKDASPGARTR